MRFCEKFINDFNVNDIEIIKNLSCIYTTTPDEDFIIDYLPDTNDKVLIVSACSGHGFKFCSRTGEHASNLLDFKEKPIDHFKINRLLKIIN
jgi:glycine/D-amino acid oxidase-like deaminating enzyme